jgi:acetyl-CoA carboxylase carboxyltransferase component
MPGTRQEAAGVIRHGAALVRAFAAATASRVTVILRKAYGGAFITMNSKQLGADACFGWPGVEIGIMSPRSAVEIMDHRQLRDAEHRERRAAELAERYAEEYLSPETALAQGAIDAVIEPAQTRALVTAALFGDPISAAC